ncbi:hypothetical protein [Polaribacter tangerinus]|uniref:hypothetical protein n=1 Tax=Polaribacter tangerinus TaxID=1920034 RepID=UPI000B4BF32C|nr:hypothetical protein [Polaribacter tangerinus]
MKKLLLVLLLISCTTLAQTFDNIPTGKGYYINKLIVNPSGDDLTNEYIEIRGPKGAIIPSNLYLISIEGDGESGKTNMGKVDEALQLGDGNRTFGTNGIVAVVCNYTDENTNVKTNNPYSTFISTDATVITIELTGNDVTGSSSSNTSTKTPDIGYDGNFLDPSATYMLITSDANPDARNIDTSPQDGIIDATGDHITQNWVLYDSVSYLDDDDFDTVLS